MHSNQYFNLSPASMEPISQSQHLTLQPQPELSAEHIWSQSLKQEPCIAGGAIPQVQLHLRHLGINILRTSRKHAPYLVYREIGLSEIAGSFSKLSHSQGKAAYSKMGKTALVPLPHISGIILQIFGHTLTFARFSIFLWANIISI